MQGVKHESLLQIVTEILMEMVKHSGSYQKLQCLNNISKKKEVRDEVDFLHGDKHQVSGKLISSLGYLSFLQGDSIIILFMMIIKDSQSTLSSKFAISLQYLEKEVRNGVHFLHRDKH